MSISTAFDPCSFRVPGIERGVFRYLAVAMFLLLAYAEGHAGVVSPACPIVSGNFQGLAAGTTSAANWSIDASGLASTAKYFAVRSNRFHAEDIGGIGIWRSTTFSVAGYSSFQVALKITAEGDQNSTEYVKVYYRVNGGAETLLSERTGNFGTIDFISPELTGNNVQMIVKIYNYDNGGSQTSKYYIEDYRVFKEDGPCAGTISVSASANRTTLTCANTSATLSATSSASGVTYSWSGPNSFTSTAQNPTVSAAGTYTVTATSSSGTATASVTITENKTAPGVTATGGSLSCASSVTLTASSSTSGVTYSWTGPNNFTSTTQNPVVSATGTYTVTATNPANGCTSVSTATVTASGATTPAAFWLEDFTLSNGATSDTGATPWSISNPGSGTFSVQNNEFMAAFSAANEGVWSSGVVDISTRTNVVVSVDLKSGTASSNDYLETSDYIQVYYKLNGGAETLIYSDVAGLNGVDNGTSTLAVTSGSLNGSTLQVVIRLKNSDVKERYYIDNVKMTGASAASSSLTVSASASSTVTCSSTSATLTATASVAGASYSWSGPNGYTSTQQNPVVTAGGTYTVTASQGGCTASASVVVSENKTAPGVTATGGNLSCASSITLSASSSVSGVTYSWTGPNGFSSTTQNPSVSTAGTYTVTARNPANGCTSSQSVTVTGSVSGTLWQEDFTLANGATSDTGSTSWTTQNGGASVFSVNSNEFKVSGTGTSSQGVWTSGQIAISGQANVTISAGIRSSGATMNTDGTYMDYLRVYYKLNGGSEVLFSETLGGINNNSTNNTTISTGGLSGSTLQIVVKARATGTDEFYYFDNVKVTGIPVSSSLTVSTSVSGVLTCANTAVTLSASASVTGATYSWTGPNGFSSVQQNPSVNTPGQYTVTALAGGCAALATVTVTENKAAPSVTAAGATLACSASSVTITASSATSGATYAWTGPGGFTSTQQNPSVTTPGSYTVTVRNPTNGCTASQSVQVTATSGSTTAATFWNEDFTFANGTTTDTGTTSWSISNAGSGTFSVQNNEFMAAFTAANEGIWQSGVVNIAGKSDVVISVDLKSGTAGSGDYLETDDYIRVYYKLNGGAETLVYGDVAGLNGIDNGTATLSVSSAALSGNTLQVVIRARNTSSTERYYFDNVKLTGKDSPIGVISVSASGALSCVNPSVQLSASVAASGATYYWIAPNGDIINQQNPTVTTPGIYSVVVTANGCRGGSMITVTGNATAPDVSIIGNNLSCAPGSTAVLQAFSSVAGITYTWTGPGSFSATSASPSITQPGTYTVTGTNPANQCSATASFTVAYSAGASTAVWSETFDDLTDGTTTDTGATPWSVDNSKIHTVDLSHYSDETGTPYYFEVRSGKLTAKTTRGEVKWTSQPIAISSFGQVQIQMNITGEGSLNDTTDCGSDCFDYDYVKFFYKLNGGAEIPFSVNGSFPGKRALDSLTASTGIISGNTLQIIAVIYNTGNNEIIYIDDIQVLKIEPATGGTVNASASGMITCANPTVTLSATPVDNGATYSWSGPGGFQATGVSVNAGQAGTYALVVTGGAGCLAGATGTVVVQENKALPVVSVNTPPVLTCAVTSATLQASASPSSGLTFTWQRPDGSTVSSSGLTVSTPGVYKITVTNTANGCATETTVNVSQNNTAPDATTSVSGAISCTTSSVTVTGSSTTQGVTYSWSGPGGFMSTSPSFTTSTAGVYALTVTNPGTGCTTQRSVTVAGNSTAPDATASASGPISCTNSSVTVTGSSTTQGVTYSWTGPGSFTSTSASFTTSTAGVYTLTVTNTSTGCTTQRTVTVTGNTAIPDATASASGTITCTNSSITVTGSSTTQGVTYGWTGPGGFTSIAPSFTTSTAGVYTLTVTNSSTGCTTQRTVTVTGNTTIPDATASASGTITCTNSSITVTGASTTQGVTYGWTGPGGFTSIAPSFTTSTAGVYTLTVTNQGNGCTTQKTVTVTGNATVPANVSAAASGSLSCSNSSVTLTGTSTTSGVTYSWTGPSGFISATQNPAVTIPGTYTLTVTFPASGCTATATVTVSQNNTLPVVTASVSGILTCITNSVNLAATPTGAVSLAYVWTGPGGFTATVKNPLATVAGVYTVVAIDPSSGCTSASSSVTVQENRTAPGASIATPEELTCTRLTISLQASSPTAGVQYSWTGPGGFTSTEQAPVTTLAGNYTVTVIHPVNGCTSTASTTVNQNNTAPTGVTATASGMLTCTASSITLNGASTTSGVTYSWTGPNNFTSNAQNPSVTVPGVYHLTVSGGTGCTQTADVTVGQDNAPPAGVTAAAASALTCTNTSTTLTGTSTTPGVMYVWAGPGGFSSASPTPTVTAAGTYTLVVLNPINGCSAPAAVTVSENKAVPANVTASVSGDLSCSATQVTLQGSSSTVNATYHWTGPQGYSSNERNPVTDIVGNYTLTVTHPESGCTATATAAVQQGNGTIPGGVTASASGTLTCASTTVTLTASATGSDIAYSWTGPNGFTATGASVSVSAAGAYSVTAANAGACSATGSVTVSEDKAAPNANIANNTSNTPVLTCYINPLIYTGISSTPGATFSWTNASGIVVSGNAVISVTAPGTYTLTVTAPNGCTTQRMRTVTQTLTQPTANVSVGGNITCTQASVTLTGSSSGSPVTYSWSGPSGFTSASQSPAVTIAGDYTLTVRTPGGCTAQKTVSVSENKTLPEGVTFTITGEVCRDGFLTLNGISTTSGVTYHWSSDSGFTSDEQNPVTTLGGIYTLTVTNAANGCVSTHTEDVFTQCP